MRIITWPKKIHTCIKTLKRVPVGAGRGNVVGKCNKEKKKNATGEKLVQTNDDGCHIQFPHLMFKVELGIGELSL